MKLSSIYAVAGAAVALCLSQPAAAKHWLRADTHNFIIYSDGSQKQLVTFATDVEKFDSLLHKLFNVPSQDKPNRLTIFAINDQQNVAHLAQDKSRLTAGFYSPEREGSFAVINREQADSKFDLSGQATLFHEYAHHFMFRNADYAYPAWYVEGFAEFLATAEFKSDGSWNFGKPPLYRALDIVYGTNIPIEKLLFSDISKLKTSEVTAFYGRAWLLVHFLYFKPERSKQLENYLRALGKGTDPKQAASEAFGDLKQLGKELDKYTNVPLYSRESTQPLDYFKDVSVKELDDVHSRLVELSMVRRVGKEPEKAESGLEKLAADAPGDAPVLLELALAQRDLAETTEHPDFTAAEKTVDLALAKDANLERANVLKAELMAERLNDKGIEDVAQWKQVRRYIHAANQQDTEDPLPLLAFYDSYSKQHVDPPEIAHDALAKAYSLVPEDKNTRVQYAFDLAAEHHFDQAIRLIDYLVNDPHNPAQGRKLLAQLEALRDGRPYLDTPDVDVEQDGTDGGGDGSGGSDGKKKVP